MGSLFRFSRESIFISIYTFHINSLWFRIHILHLTSISNSELHIACI